ncbi:biotin--[acetyl-CoA-carboxylase] ligase [Pseudonocardia kujensis]|uniref:biotin--[acetyl-CoA-carboxylase] ligase n=1 Tax=Pseudonocardia kujensis TaxID=1128675 RepID=UPI001E299AE1|nr:biotin--[acetyl-CoA-carboxylase] ligase [Pseudonocardia kujensis]MCE0766666.1 biotin--[acetyl-CoA-carboxylase] ligase [Pseudonocardia kujensis]
MSTPAPQPFDEHALRHALLGPAGRWARLDVVEETGSTNADLMAEALAGAPDGSVLVTEHQTKGRGRLDRTWEAPRGSGIAVSVLWRPEGIPAERLGWLPMLAGVALLDAIRTVAPDVASGLKWPNDLLLGHDRRKGAGILAEMTPVSGGGPGVVLGMGVNVDAPAGTLPETATSLAAEGARVDRSELLVTLLRNLAEREAAWRAAAGDADESGLRADYRAGCLSLGSEVRVEMPGGTALVGMAEDVDPQGHLLVLEPDGHRRAIAAGDIVHLRPADRPDA